MKQMKEKAIEYDSSAHICFVDLVKAFDRTRLDDIIKMLIERKVPANIVKIIHTLNINNTKIIKAATNTTESIPTPGGIRQGDSLRSLLFNLLMDIIIKEVSSLNLEGIE